VTASRQIGRHRRDARNEQNMTALTTTPQGRRIHSLDAGHDSTVAVIVLASLGMMVSLGAAVGTALGMF
jgi:hypothetical protein